MIQILPSVLTADKKEYQAKIEKIEESGAFEDGWVHVDFMDNQFVPNVSVGVDSLKEYPTNLHIEAHLMVNKPEEWVEELINAGVERIIIHVETIRDSELLDLCKKEKVEVGLAIKLETPVAKLEPFVSKLDKVLVMSIHPGFSGQEFLEEAWGKIREIREVVGEKGIEVDGGVTAKLVPKLEEEGVSGVIMASKLVEGDINENLEKIWEEYELSRS